jgi:hypothetical protein
LHQPLASACPYFRAINVNAYTVLCITDEVKQDFARNAKTRVASVLAARKHDAQLLLQLRRARFARRSRFPA